jgi:hypothetical protein
MFVLNYHLLFGVFFYQPIYCTIGDRVLEASQTKSYIVFVAVAVVVGFSEIANRNPTDDSG